MPTIHEIIKNKKNTIRSSRGVNGRYNHPHRLELASVSGDVTYTVDERDFTTPPTSPDLYEFSLTLSVESEWTRIFQEQTPWSGSSLPAGSLSKGEFAMWHRPLHRMWQASCSYGARPDSAIVGTLTKTPYSGSPLVAGTPVVTNVTFDFVFFLSLGGFPASGGKATGADTEKCEFEFNESWGGTQASLLPNFFTIVKNLPWTDSWPSETAAFATIMANHVADGNAADGGGYSGSTTIALDFTNQP